MIFHHDLKQKNISGFFVFLTRLIDRPVCTVIFEYIYIYISNVRRSRKKKISKHKCLITSLLFDHEKRHNEGELETNDKHYSFLWYTYNRMYSVNIMVTIVTHFLCCLPAIRRMTRIMSVFLLCALTYFFSHHLASYKR